MVMKRTRSPEILARLASLFSKSKLPRIRSGAGRSFQVGHSSVWWTLAAEKDYRFPFIFLNLCLCLVPAELQGIGQEREELVLAVKVEQDLEGFIQGTHLPCSIVQMIKG